MEATELICFKCKHFDPAKMGCNAFLYGIPEEITSGENKHSKPLRYQENEIVFEKIIVDDRLFR